MDEFSGRGAEPLITSRFPSIRRRLWCSLAVIVWSLGVATGTLYGIRYEATAGKTDFVRDQWPAGTGCKLSSRRPSLVMFVHPRCPCSRASLSELSLLMTHCHGLVDAQVLFLQPSTLSADWSRTDLWDSASRIPDVNCRLDPDGIEHRRFNASVSGEVFLYHPNGNLSFHGGITAGRGHAGDNRGRTAIETLLLQRIPTHSSTPVFGCELESPDAFPVMCGVRAEKGTSR